MNLMFTMFSGYDSPYSLTMNQVNKLKGKVIKGETGTPIIFWKLKDILVTEKDSELDHLVEKRKTIRLLRYFTVFNAEQIEGIEFKKPEVKDLGTIADIDKVIENMLNKPTFKNGMGCAYYSPTFDHIGMPAKDSFVSLEKYYSTLFHELVHSTGHTDRLSRATVMGGLFKSHSEYSFEELIAELGASFLNAMFGINTSEVDDNSAAYLQGWLKQFESNPDMLYKAASNAQKGVDYILGKIKEKTQENISKVAQAA